MISLDQAKWHLRIVGNDDDAELGQKLNLAQSIVMQYLGDLRGDYLLLDPNEDPDAVQIDARRLKHQDAIRAAILLVVAELWANREASTANPLSESVRLILQPAREVPLA